MQYKMDCTTNCRLVDHGTYLTSAVSACNIETLRTILPKKCSNVFRNTDADGRNLLHVAASCGHIDVILWVTNEIKSISFLQMKDKESGWSALHRALYYGQIDCGITIFKVVSDWESLDFEGNSPLDLVVLDSPRTKKRQKSIKKLAIVQLPFESGDIGELTLKIGDVIEILHANKSGWAVGRLTHNGYKGLFPLNFVEEIIEEPIEIVERKHEQNDAYMWGNNINFTLGQGHKSNCNYPELVDGFWEINQSILSVSISEFHSVFLTTVGEVFSCGHGQGGRLGHNEEETAMVPKKISFQPNIFCKAISAASHHTIVLDELGQVWSFGLNNFHQLGHTPPTVKCVSPTQLSHKFLKGKEIQGIGAAKWHSVMYTNHELFTFGLNAGQLGHPKGERFQTIPKVVSFLYRKESSIRQVVVSDGATMCLMKNGDIYLLQDYICRKIGVKMVDIVQLAMSGGQLDYKGMENVTPEPLKVMVLHGSGIVESWKHNYKNFKRCYWLGKKLNNKKIVHLALGKHVLLVTDDGQTYMSYYHNKDDFKEDNTLNVRPTSTTKVEVLSGRYSLNEIAEKYKVQRKEHEEMHIEKVSLLYRSVKCFSDSRSKTFAVIQADPRSGLTKYPHVSSSSMKKDFSRLFSEAALADDVHDSIVITKSNRIPVHRFILMCRLQSGDVLSNAYNEDEKIFFDFHEYSENELKEWLSKVYEGHLDNFDPPFDPPEEKGKETNKKDDTVDDLSFSNTQFLNVDLENPTGDFSDFMDDKSTARILKQRGKQKCSAYVQAAKEIVKEKKKEGYLKIKKKNKDCSLCTFENWKSFSRLYDVVLDSEDGKYIKCHKSVLVARLEYFSSMFCNAWLESSLIKDGVLKMSIPYNVLSVLIDYLYTDQAIVVNDSTDISFIGEVLVCADQYLIIRLKEICELALSEKVSLKNSVELLKFSCTFNADQLKLFVCEFMSLNMPYYLEARLLEDLSYEELKTLSEVYKQMVVGMETRTISPSSIYKLVDQREEAESQELTAELNKLKKRQRRKTLLNNTKQLDGSELLKVESENLKDAKDIRKIKGKGEGGEQTEVGEQTEKAASNALGVANVIDPLTVKHTKTKKMPGSSAFKKKSQRERKHSQRQEDVLTEKKTTVETSSPFKGAWAHVDNTPPVASFKEVLSKEEKDVKESITPKKPSKKAFFPSRNSIKKTPEAASYSSSDAFHPDKNPWKTINSSTNNAFDFANVKNLPTIINFQKEEKEQLAVQSKKPITVIQLEERAMEELREYYESAAHQGEYITVSRAKSVQQLPFWDRVMIE